jgi:hypothetical protein
MFQGFGSGTPLFLSQVDASRAADLSYLEGTFLARGELVCALSDKHMPEH